LNAKSEARFSGLKVLHVSGNGCDKIAQ
jgi:hypothetical protein